MTCNWELTSDFPIFLAVQAVIFSRQTGFGAQNIRALDTLESLGSTTIT